MIGSILEAADLLRITGYQRIADAVRCLQRQGIHVYFGKNGPWTTVELVNAAGGIQLNGNPETYNAAAVF